MALKSFLKLLGAEQTGGGAGEPPVFRITSTNLDRHKDRVLAIKSEGDEFSSPVLWNHDDWSPAIGRARCYRENGQWLMTPVFDEVCDTSKEVAGKVKAGTLKECSIRFIPCEGHDPVPNAEGGHDFPLVEVLEVSIVNMAGNQDAVRLRSAQVAMERGEKDFRATMTAELAHLKAGIAKLLKRRRAAEDEDVDDEEPTDEEPSEEKDVDDEEPSDEEPSEEKDVDDEEPTDEEPSEEEDVEDEEPTDEEPSEEEDVEDEEPTDEEPSEEEDVEDEEPSEEEDVEDEEPSGEEDVEDEEPSDEEDELPEGKAKALRAQLVKHLGFTQAQAKALTSADLRAYAAHLPAK